MSEGGLFSGGLFSGGLFSGGLPVVHGISDLPQGLLAGWLAGALAALGLSLGAMGLLAIHLLTGGRWGETLRPALRAMVLALPAGLLALAPLVLAMPALFPWTAPAETLPEIVQKKLAWLDPGFLALRTALCVVVWLGLAALLLGRTRPGARQGALQGGAVLPVVTLVALTLGISVLDIDWILSLEPEFYSTIHPLIAICAMLLGAVSVGLAWTAADPDPSGDAAERREEIANLTLGFLLLWGYMHYMQWLIVWAADLPHEIAWYLARDRDGWGLVRLAVAGLPMLAGIGLGWPRMKRTPGRVGALAALVLLTYGLDTVWRIVPPLAGPAWGLITVVAVGLAVGFVLIPLARRTGTRGRERRHA
jgi:hypothetical protein